MLLVEIGFFHRATKLAFEESMHSRMRCSGKIYWNKNKGLLQVPGVSSVTIWLNSISLWKKSWAWWA